MITSFLSYLKKPMFKCKTCEELREEIRKLEFDNQRLLIEVRCSMRRDIKLSERFLDLAEQFGWRPPQ